MTASPNPTPIEPSWREALALPLGAVGAILGALVGSLLFAWLYRRGLYAPFLVGGLTGIAARFAAGRPSIAVAGIAFGTALAISILAQWHFFNTFDDDSLSFFIKNLPTLGISFHILGAAIAAYLAWRK